MVNVSLSGQAAITAAGSLHGLNQQTGLCFRTDRHCRGPHFSPVAKIKCAHGNLWRR